MLTDADRRLIEAAVTDVETRTRGEIFCVVAQESSDYREVPLAWAAIAALGGPAILLMAGVHVTIPDLFGGQEWTAAQIGAAAEQAARAALAGAIVLQGIIFLAVTLLVAVPGVRRAMTPRSLKRERVRRRALEQFMAKNLQATRERTGILIYVSIRERLAELIADEGVAAKVERKAWDRAMESLVSGIKRGDAGQGFEAAIRQCGDILAEHFPADATDNPNELPDSLVILP